uniref:Uncharacterized protein n=1 Tax=Triticum urartu TaxID=4572 RepID=A0A8R7US03_TRIUA
MRTGGSSPCGRRGLSVELSFFSCSPSNLPRAAVQRETN